MEVTHRGSRGIELVEVFQKRLVDLPDLVEDLERAFSEMERTAKQAA